MVFFKEITLLFIVSVILLLHLFSIIVLKADWPVQMSLNLKNSNENKIFCVKVFNTVWITG